MNKEFVWKRFYDQKYSIQVQANVSMPFTTPHEQFCCQLLEQFHIPPFAEKEFRANLFNFLEDFYKEYYQAVAEKQCISYLDVLTDNTINELADSLTELYQRTTVLPLNNQSQIPESGAPESSPSDEEKFVTQYKALVHSEHLPNLIQWETHFAQILSNNVDARNMAISDMEKRHERELHNLMVTQQAEERKAAPGSQSRRMEHRVNALTQEHCEERQLLTSQWETLLQKLREEQKCDYREIVKRAHEALEKNEVWPAALICNSSPAGSSLEAHLSFSSEQEKSSDSSLANGSNNGNSGVLKEESFTITMGRQCRSTHNIRIMRADVLDWLCGWRAHEPVSTRMNTALSLYSANLSAVVLLVDGRVSTTWGMHKEMAKHCELSTDFHFPAYEAQLKMIRHHFKQLHSPVMEGGGRGSSAQAGDVYVTVHSNLPSVQVVFHVHLPEEVMYAQHLRYPSPVHHALRCVLHTCFVHDIPIVTLPLLLVHQLRDGLTNAMWCARRAETVLNALKAAMLEFSKWKGQESKTIQLCVPAKISEELFDSLGSMISTFFESTPAIFSTF